MSTENRLDSKREAGWSAADQQQAAEAHRFLKEGDFEKYQPACYMDPTSKEYAELTLSMLEEKCRADWLYLRFCLYYSEEWHRRHDSWHQTYQEYCRWETIIRNWGKPL